MVILLQTCVIKSECSFRCVQNCTCIQLRSLTWTWIVCTGAGFHGTSLPLALATAAPALSCSGASPPTTRLCAWTPPSPTLPRKGFKERLINAINEETIYLLKWLFAANTFTFWIVTSLTAKSFSRKHHQDEEERQLHEHGDHLHLTHYRRIRLANYWTVHYRFSFQIRLFQFYLWHCRMTHCC